METAVTDEGYAALPWQMVLINAEPFGPESVLGMPDNPSLSWWVDVPLRNFYCLTTTARHEFAWSVVPGVTKTVSDKDGIPVTFFVPKPMLKVPTGLGEFSWSLQVWEDAGARPKPIPCPLDSEVSHWVPEQHC